MKLDFLIENGRVVDGTGAPARRCSVGIKGDRIAYMGDDAPPAERRHDAAGAVVCPGFVDLHSHGDMAILLLPEAENYVRQGVSTIVTGNCGLSLAPCDDRHMDMLRAYLASFLPSGMDGLWNWRGFGAFLDEVEKTAPAVNIVPLVGHGTIRIACEGFDRSPARGARLDAMGRLLEACLSEGAWGMSTGLIYPPGTYSDDTELAHFFEILGKRGALYTTHLRSEGKFLLECVEEAVRLAERYGTPLELSHHKSAPADASGRVEATLALMREARSRGVDVLCDVYPYTASSTTITALLPSAALEGGVERLLDALGDEAARSKLADEILSGAGGEECLLDDLPWDRIAIVSCPGMPACEGRTLDEIVLPGDRAERVTRFLCWMRDVRATGMMVLQSMWPKDVDRIVAEPESIVASDSWLSDPDTPEKCHPRSFGTFPQFIHTYVCEKRILPLEEAIRKITSLPARRMGLTDRGVLRIGMKADVLVFELGELGNLPTFDEPKRFPSGIRSLWINGAQTLAAGERCGRSGRVLRRNSAGGGAI